MSHSETLFARAQSHIPGGVNSPVRAFAGVGGHPIFFKRAEGPYLYDEDDKQYIDYIGSWGPMILGHANPKVTQAVTDACQNGLSYGAPTELEIQMAETICEFMPSIEQVRMVNSGTEATMSAIRLARGFTGRNLIIKFEGCYHGHVDSLLVNAGSGALTLGTPSSPGIPDAVANQTLIATFNDLNSVEQLFTQYQGEIAAIIVEPVAGNMNCIAPVDGFLQGLRALCDKHSSVLIFDEVMTGFRVALGGAQALYDVKPDLTTLGKVIGGGMPVGAFGGKKDIMSQIAPSGPVYQAGTLSGNPIAMTAGLETLRQLQVPGFYDALGQKAKQLTTGVQQAADKHGVAFTTEQIGGMFGLFFTTETKVENFKQTSECHIARFKRFFHHMLDQGVYLAPSAYEAGFISAAHTDEVIETTIRCADEAFSRL